MVRWDDFKADVKEVFDEFKKHKIGWIGVSLIGFMVLLGMLAPVIAPGVHEEWGRGHSRWEANPANAPPVWVDWITGDDYARHEVIEEWDYDDRAMGYERGEATFERDIIFDELGNRNFEVRDAEGQILESHSLEIVDGEAIDNVTIENFTVEVEDDLSPEGAAPITYGISADLTHDEEVEENRTVALNIDDTAIESWEMTYEGENRTREIELSHTFVSDDYYVIDFREEGGDRGQNIEFVKVGVGMDVKVEGFNVIIDQEDLVVDMETEAIENMVDEEREIVYRINRVDTDEDGLIVSRDPIYSNEWTLDRFERIEDITDEYTLPEEGDYEFIFGPERTVERDVGLEEDLETASFEEGETEDEDSLSGQTGLQQQAQDEPDMAIDIDAPFPEVTIGDLETIEVEIRNSEEEDYQLDFYMVHEREEEEEDEEQLLQEIAVPPAGQLKRHYFTFTYDMEADVPPRELFVAFNARADAYYFRRLRVERPDGIVFNLEDLRRDRVGEFRETISMVRRNQIQDNVHRQVEHYLRTEENASATREPFNLNLPRTVFGQAGEDWMEYPEALKGQYNITLAMDGVNVEMDEASVTLSGAVYGVMGTDSGRRDIFHGWVWGARYGLIAGGLIALTTIIFGTTFGMTSAYYGGWVDEFMQRLNEILMGIPTLPILIIILQFWMRSIWAFVLIYALLMWRGAAKVIRSRGLQVAKDTYVEAAESLGSGSGRIIAKHMIPQILPYAIAQAALLVPIVIMAEAGLHILGLGDPNIVTWGTLLNEARGSGAVYNWEESWFWILFPGVGMMLVGFGFISTGMAIERIINPKMKQR